MMQRRACAANRTDIEYTVRPNVIFRPMPSHLIGSVNELRWYIRTIAHIYEHKHFDKMTQTKWKILNERRKKKQRNATTEIHRRNSTTKFCLFFFSFRFLLGFVVDFCRILLCVVGFLGVDRRVQLYVSWDIQFGCGHFFVFIYDPLHMLHRSNVISAHESSVRRV